MFVKQLQFYQFSLHSYLLSIMNMRIPFKWAPKGVEDADKAGNKVFGFIQLIKHTKNDTTDSKKQTVKERTIFKEKMTEFFVDGKNTVAVSALN